MSPRRSLPRAFADALSGADVEAMTAMLAPGVVMRGTVGGLDEQRVLRGSAAVMSYYAEVVANWDTLSVEVERILEGERAFVLYLREVGRAEHSGVELARKTALVARTADARIVELRGYLDREDALAAAEIACAE